MAVQVPLARSQASAAAQQVTAWVVGLSHGGPPAVHWQLPSLQLWVSAQSTAVAQGPM
jgi:hypothetical protein